MITWPAMVPVKVELWPEASSATPNSAAATPEPTIGSSRWYASWISVTPVWPEE